MNKVSHTILPPPAHSRRAAHFLKPLPIAALAALLAAPAAWAANSGGQPFTDHWDDSAYGGFGSYNTNVIFDETSTFVDAYGGYSATAPADPRVLDKTGKANGNKLTVTGTVDFAIGGGAHDAAGNAEANGNTLTVKGTVTEAIGGYSEGSATGNFVFIHGGTAHSVEGGFARSGNATRNTVTLISGKVTGSVWGGSSSDCSTYDCVTGNTLAVQGKVFTVGGDVTNFDTLNLDLSTVGANDVVLDVGGTADFSKVTAAKFSFNLADGAALKPGDTITLIKAGSLKLPALPASVTACGHEFELLTTATALTATVKEPPTPDPTPTPDPAPSGGDSSSPTMGELGLLLSGLALAGAAAPALRRRERKARKQD